MPLAKEETQLIGSFTNRGDRVVPMSEALKDGDQVVVMSGPLLGHEGLIKTINRRKSTAFFGAQPVGRRVTTRVGLAVLSNEQRVMRNSKSRLSSCKRSLHRTGRISDLGTKYWKRTCRKKLNMQRMRQRVQR